MGLLVIYAARDPLILAQMHGTFMQKVFLTMILALAASGLVECWKFTIKANDEINAPQNWQHTTKQ
jgi:hypothetical protein